MLRYKVQLLPSAFADIESAMTWYEQHGSTLPDRFFQQVSSSIERLKITPFAHSIRYKDVRIANLGVFPYAVHYFLKEKNVIIIAIHHTALSPRKWQER